MDHVVSIVLTFFVHLINPQMSADTKTTVQADVTVEPSVSPTVSPTVTPTVTPTGTVTPTITPSITPSISPVQEEDGDKDDMFGLKADEHALVGLLNAAFHHEENESRFDAKHGDKPNENE